MTKVILTKEQGDSINRSLESNGGDSSKVLLLFIGGLLHGANSCLKKLTLEQMTKALLIGYEIEQPKFEVGDWVVGNSGTIHKLIKDAGSDFFTKTLEGKEGYASPNYIRPATEEEKFWFELGRKVGELKDNDVIFTEFHNAYRICNDNEDDSNGWVHLSEAKRWFKENTIVGFYPAESFKTFPTGNE